MRSQAAEREATLRKLQAEREKARDRIDDDINAQMQQARASVPAYFIPRSAPAPCGANEGCRALDSRGRPMARRCWRLLRRRSDWSRRSRAASSSSARRIRSSTSSSTRIGRRPRRAGRRRWAGGRRSRRGRGRRPSRSTVRGERSALGVRGRARMPARSFSEHPHLNSSHCVEDAARRLDGSDSGRVRGVHRCIAHLLSRRRPASTRPLPTIEPCHRAGARTGSSVDRASTVRVGVATVLRAVLGFRHCECALPPTRACIAGAGAAGHAGSTC